MSVQEVKTGAITESGQKLIITSFAVAFAAIVIAMPQPVEPSEGLPLELDTAATHEALAADAERAAGAASGEAAESLRERLLELSRSEVGRQTRDQRLARLDAVKAAREALVAEAGEEAVAAERSRAALAVDAFREGELDDDAALEAMGSFVELAEIYGLMRSDRAVAPLLVFRSIFKARWNAMVGLEATEGLSAVELQALWGWPALQAHNLPAAQRRVALQNYQDVGGTISTETRAIQAYQAGEYEVATRLFREDFEATGNLRLRNHALWTQAMGLVQ